MTTTYLDLFAIACLVLFAFAVWPPAALLVAGLLAAAVSWRQS